MTPNFALSLAFDGLHLMHRTSEGWEAVGTAPLDDAHLGARLAELRERAEALEPGRVSVKLLIPNDQIRYLVLDDPHASAAEVRGALDGATPYPLDELVYDHVSGGGRTYVAAVARETLEEAETFAEEHGFAPVAFAASPEPFTFMGEVFFGPGKAAGDAPVERDEEPVMVTGSAAMGASTAAESVASPTDRSDLSGILPDPAAPSTTAQSGPASGETSGPAEEAGGEAARSEADTPAEPQGKQHIASEQDTPASEEASGTTAQREAESPLPAKEDANTTPEVPAAAAETAHRPGDASPTAEPPAAEEAEPSDAQTASEASGDIGADGPSAPAPGDGEPAIAGETEPSDEPVFSTRLRAEAETGGDAAEHAEATSEEAVDATAEVSFRHHREFPLTASRDTETPSAAPAIGGAARESGSVEPGSTDRAAQAEEPPEPPRSRAAMAAAAAEQRRSVPSPDLGPEPASTAPRSPEASPSQPDTSAQRADQTPLRPATSVQGDAGGEGSRSAGTPTLGGAPGLGAADRQAAAREERNRLTVFGARKPEPQGAAAARSRVLGIALTIALLILLAVAAAWAAVSGSGLAGFFGSDETRVASAPVGESDPPAEAPVPPDDSEGLEGDSAGTPEASATPPSGGDVGGVLSPAEAQRKYAATGVWQRAPRIPVTPRTEERETARDSSLTPVVLSGRPVPLPDAEVADTDRRLPTPATPPPPGSDFELDENGFIRATPEGAATPDGAVVYAGAPAVVPPERPAGLAEGAVSDSIFSGVQPRLRPTGLAPEAAASGQDDAQDADTTSDGANDEQADSAPSEAETGSGASEEDGTDRSTTEDGSDGEADEADPDTASAEEAVDSAVAAAQGVEAPSTAQEASDATSPEDTLTGLVFGSAASVPEDVRPAIRPGNRPSEAAGSAFPALASSPELAGARPHLRPASLAPDPQEGTPAGESASAPEGEDLGTGETEVSGPDIAAISAAVREAAENTPDPFEEASDLAIAFSERPDPRPGDIPQMAERIRQQRASAREQLSSAAAQPSGATPSSVAQAATDTGVFNFRSVSLIGISGGEGDRRALVRLQDGRLVRVTVGDSLDGGRVRAIGKDSLNYVKGGRSHSIKMPS